VLAEISRRWVGVTFGLWFFDIGGVVAPERYEHHHIYGRADLLCQIQMQYPKQNAYMMTDEEFKIKQKIVIDKAPYFSDYLKEFLDIETVLERYRAGRFVGCLIRHEARAYLDEGHESHQVADNFAR
jgi:hypothetical protein